MNTVSGPPRGTDVRRERLWSPILGAGALSWERDGWWLRFDGDDGRTTRLHYNLLAIGTPDYVKRDQEHPARNIRPTDEENRWMTVGCRDGTVMAFRESAPPAPPPDPHAGQLALPLDKP